MEVVDDRPPLISETINAVRGAIFSHAAVRFEQAEINRFMQKVETIFD